MKPAAFEQFAALEREHWWFRGRRRVYLGLLRGALRGTRPRRVLDVGAGVGGFLDELAVLGDELHYAEADGAALRACRTRGHSRGVRADAAALPYAARTFDLVTLFDVLEHIDDDLRALREVRRVLTPGGVVLLSVPAHPWLFSRNDVVARHRRRYTRGGLRELLASTDLHVLRLTFANAALFPAIAAFLLAGRVLESLELSHGEHERTNLSWRLPRFADELAYRVFSAELALSRRWDLPMGHSLVAIAVRRDLAPLPLGHEPAPRGARLTRALTASAPS